MSDTVTERKSTRVRETRICAVPTCKNKRVGKKDDSGPSFHRFPKDPAIRQAWIDQCKIVDNFNPDNASVCSDHFEFDDFERSYQKQLMGIERRPMLKKNVIPHLNLPVDFITTDYQGELKNHIKTRFQGLIQINDPASNMSKKNYDIEIKTIDVLSKTEAVPPEEEIIFDYESDLESLCVQSVEDNVVSQIPPIENIQIEPDYKILYLQTKDKYEKLKSKMLEIENKLVKEQKRADEYQTILTKIFAEGEMHLLYERKKVS